MNQRHFFLGLSFAALMACGLADKAGTGTQVGNALQAQIFLPDGRPVSANMQVRSANWTGLGAGNNLSITSGNNGVAEFSWPTGEFWYEMRSTMGDSTLGYTGFRYSDDTSSSLIWFDTLGFSGSMQGEIPPEWGMSPTIGAIVTLLGNGKSDTVGADGRWQFQDLVPGTYRLQFWLGDSLPLRLEQRTLPTGTNLRVDLRWEESSQLLQMNLFGDTLRNANTFRYGRIACELILPMASQTESLPFRLSMASVEFPFGAGDSSGRIILMDWDALVPDSAWVGLIHPDTSGNWEHGQQILLPAPVAAVSSHWVLEWSGNRIRIFLNSQVLFDREIIEPYEHLMQLELQGNMANQVLQRCHAQHYRQH